MVLSRYYYQECVRVHTAHSSVFSMFTPLDWGPRVSRWMVTTIVRTLAQIVVCAEFGKMFEYICDIITNFQIYKNHESPCCVELHPGHICSAWIRYLRNCDHIYLCIYKNATNYLSIEHIL